MPSVSGTITDASGVALANTPVRLYRRDTGALLGSTLTGDGSAETLGDEHYNSVSLLLHMNGANNSTIFTDNSQAPKTITRYGNAKIVTSYAKFDLSSAYFDGSTAYLDTPPSSDLAFGTGDFTFEFWIYSGAVGSGGFRRIVAHPVSSNAAGTFQIAHCSSTSYGATVDSVCLADPSFTTTSLINLRSVITDGNWHHIAFTRKGTTLRGFFDGIIEGTTTDATNFTEAGTRGFRFGQRGDLNSSVYFNGYLQDVRVTKGLARYTSDFALPIAPYPDSALIPAKPLGEYTIATTYADEVQRIVLAPDGGTLYNDLIDRVIPG